MERVLRLLENSRYQQQWFGTGISSNKIKIHFGTLGIRSKFPGKNMDLHPNGLSKPSFLVKIIMA